MRAWSGKNTERALWAVVVQRKCLLAPGSEFTPIFGLASTRRFGKGWRRTLLWLHGYAVQ